MTLHSGTKPTIDGEALLFESCGAAAGVQKIRLNILTRCLIGGTHTP